MPRGLTRRAARVAAPAVDDSSGRGAGSPAAEEPDLGLQPYAALLPHHPLGQIHQRLDVNGACPALVHDEVRVLLRDARAARPGPLQSRHVDESPGVIAGRVLEDRAGIGLPMRLGSDASRARVLHASLDGGAPVAMQAEAYRRHDEARGELRPTVAKG